MDGGAGLKLLAGRISTTIERAGHEVRAGEPANACWRPHRALGSATKAAWSTGQPEEALANATPYLQAFGHVVLAWLWLDVAMAARRAGHHRWNPASWPRCATSSPTSCRASMPGWVWWPAARRVCREMQDDWF
jgi:hypothetical protein